MDEGPDNGSVRVLGLWGFIFFYAVASTALTKSTPSCQIEFSRRAWNHNQLGCLTMGHTRNTHSRLIVFLMRKTKPFGAEPVRHNLVESPFSI